jgi:hypothetical protein
MKDERFGYPIVSQLRNPLPDKKEIDKATWRKARGIRLTSTSRYIRHKLFPLSGSEPDQSSSGWRLTIKAADPALEKS